MYECTNNCEKINYNLSISVFIKVRKGREIYWQ